MELLINYLPLIAVCLWFFYKWWNSQKIIKMLPELKKKRASFVDVRTWGEFAASNAPGTINIPLNELNGRLNELPKNSPIVLCCASGTRSWMAKMLLKKNGFRDVYNIGAWTKLLH